MTQSKILTDAIGKSLKSAGFKKKSDTWFLTTEETISILNLKKSDFGRQYYVNIGVWLKCIGQTDIPKDYKCHIRFRWTSLIPQDQKQLERLLDLDNESLSDVDRQCEIIRLFEGHLLPFFSVAKTLDGLRTLYEGENWPISLVNVTAQEILTRKA